MPQPVNWPSDARCAVMLTFDLDGESPWIHRDPALADRPLHMSMGAYGPKTGAPRLLELLDRYGIRTCFFIPGWIVERYPALCEAIVRRGHEVGHHGYLHEKPFFLVRRARQAVGIGLGLAILLAMSTGRVLAAGRARPVRSWRTATPAPRPPSSRPPPLPARKRSPIIGGSRSSTPCRRS